MNQITVTGMVLISAPVGEFDRRVVILTKERGKIAAFARGARKQHSALMGVTSPFSFGEFQLYEGRTSYTLMSASISNYFAELRTDVEGAYYGFYFADLANYYAREANDEMVLLKLLYQTLRALSNPKIPNALIRCIYELKAVSINGEGPQMFECVICGDREREKVFSVKKGGMVCTECAGERWDRFTQDGMKQDGKIRNEKIWDEGIQDRYTLLPSTLYTMQYIISSPVEKLYNFVVKKEVLAQLRRVMAAYMDTYVDKRFKSLEILETIVGESQQS